MSADNPKVSGLDVEGRYDVRKKNDPDGKHDNCWYFVLDIAHDPYARAALKKYASDIYSTNPTLANDLILKMKHTPYIGWEGVK